MRAARLGLPIRPHVFHQKDEKPMDEEVEEEEAAASPKESPGASYTPCAILFLRLQGDKRGVMQVHQVSRHIMPHGRLVV